MSLIGKCFQVGSLVGTVCSAPLIPTFSKQSPVVKPTSRGGAEHAVMRNALEQVAADKGGETKGWGCFWIPDLPAVLFFCFDKNNQETAPYLFHYSWGGNKEERLNRVETLTHQKVGFKDEKYKNVSSNLITHLKWTQKWKNSPYKPSDNCRISKKTQGRSVYQLSCQTSNNSQSNPWTKDVSESQVVGPEKEVQEFA